MIFAIKQVVFWKPPMTTSYKEYLKHLLLQSRMDPSRIKNQNIRLLFKHKTQRAAFRIQRLYPKIAQSVCMTFSPSFPQTYLRHSKENRGSIDHLVGLAIHLSKSALLHAQMHFQRKIKRMNNNKQLLSMKSLFTSTERCTTQSNRSAGPSRFKRCKVRALREEDSKVKKTVKRMLSEDERPSCILLSDANPSICQAQIIKLLN